MASSFGAVGGRRPRVRPCNFAGLRRLTRLIAPDILHHMMLQGIQGRRIFCGLPPRQNLGIRILCDAGLIEAGEPAQGEDIDRCRALLGQ